MKGLEPQQLEGWKVGNEALEKGFQNKWDYWSEPEINHKDTNIGQHFQRGGQRGSPSERNGPK